MDLEAPVDAWYVWFGVALMTTAIAGVALSLPTEPAPDAKTAANVIEEGTTSQFNTSATYEHGADEVKITEIRIALRNDGGIDRATLAFGNMTPVLEHPDESQIQKGINITLGADPSEEFEGPAEMAEWARKAREGANNSTNEWRTANDTLHVRTVQWGKESVTFVYI
jgi:hypothetical protein